jgi:hypothetical protein
MAEQITGAVVWHTNTSASYSNRYSDHDAVLVGLRLGEDLPIDTSGLDETAAPAPAQKILRQGQLIIIRGGSMYSITGMEIKN